MPSRRVYITLNDEKDRDKVIINYLSQSYSESDCIKEALYRLATNSTDTMQKITNSTSKAQKVTRGDTKVQKGANNTVKVEKIPNSNKEVIKVTNNTLSDAKVTKGNNKVIKVPISNELIRQNEIDQLKEFMD